MTATAHNQFFGWVHTFKINRNNSIFNPDVATQRPFPVIIDNPTYKQVLANWNQADTGLLVSSFVFGLFGSKILIDGQIFDSLLKKRFFFRRMSNLFLVAGFYFAMNNSANRLRGYVPNGLPKKRTEQILKYDYTSQFLNQTPWKHVFSGRTRPSNQ